MDALKIENDTYALYVAEVGEDKAQDLQTLNNVIVVRDKLLGKMRYRYFSVRDFHKWYRWLEERASKDGFTAIEALPEELGDR